MTTVDGPRAIDTSGLNAASRGPGKADREIEVLAGMPAFVAAASTRDIAIFVAILCACFSFAVAGFVIHRGFVEGSYRWPAHWYFDETQPAYLRNLAFSLLPYGWMFLIWFVLLVVSRFHGQAWADLALLPLLLLSFGMFGWGIKRAIRPPESAKPDWLKTEESQG